MPAPTSNALNELATYAAGHGCGTVTAGPLPEDPDTCSSIRLYAGLPSMVAFGSAGIYRDQPLYQVLSRGPRNDRDGAYVQAKLLYDLLMGLNLPMKIPASTGPMYYTMSARQAPYELTQDDLGRYLFVFNIAVMKDPS